MPDSKLELVRISGTALRCGEAYGERFETQIMGFCRQEVTPDKNRLRFARQCWKFVERDAPDSAQFMRGIARGSRLSLDHITLLTLHEEIVHQRQPHCTAFVASGDATKNGQTIVAMNWDWAPQLYPWPGLLRLSVKGSPRAAMYHYPGLWASAGINEYGMSLMWTGSGYVPRVEPIVGVPTYVLIAEVLRRKTVEQSIDYLSRVHHAGSFIFFLADAGGATAVVEGMPGQLAIEESASCMSRANHYIDPDMIACSKQPDPRKMANSCYRAKRMGELMAQHRGSITPAIARRILTDRDGPGPFIHQYPSGKDADTLAHLTIDSLFAQCEQRVLHTSRGGRVPGPWQTIEA